METKIAVVGMGCLFPDASNVDEFWTNVSAGRVSIRPLPEEMLEHDVFFRPELLTALSKNDKTVTNIAGWIQELRFDTVRKYKIPPSVAEHMDANQHAALATAAQALAMNPLQNVPRDRVAVIYGNGMVGTQYGDALVRVEFQLVEHYLRRHAAVQKLSSAEQNELIEYLAANVLKGSIPITEDSAPGILPNIIAARIANVHDFHGPSYTVDAACASVLAAVIKGVQGLQLREFDAVICGGSDMPLKQLGFILFSALNALSPDGSFPFDERANGFVMAQGAGAVTLKRLDDAIRDKDRIYAVLTGYGATSDGKGKYIAAPNAQWQARTIEMACRMAGYPVDTIEMVEAHGTATKVGDVVEVEGLKAAFHALGATGKQYCGLTSAKSNIGHLKSAAGIAGLVKAVLSLDRKMLPPTASFQRINPKLELENSPFYVLDTLRPWEGKRDHPRRANVSSFGFGGANYHVALEEYREGDYGPGVFRGMSAEATKAGEVSQAEPGRPEVLFVSGDSPEALDQSLGEFLAGVRRRTELSFFDHCLLSTYRARADARARLALLVSSTEELEEKAAQFARLRAQAPAEILRSKGIFFKTGDPIQPSGTAILFPGQASQYPRMFRSTYAVYDTFRTWFLRADAHWLARRDQTVSSLLFPPAPSAEGEALERLRQTQNAHPAIFVSSFALHDLLRQMGLEAGFMAGHSLGEITALAASGMIDFDDALALVERRGFAFHDERLQDPGTMLSLALPAEEAARLVAESGVPVAIANINSPRQTIVAGLTPDVERFHRFLDDRKIEGKQLFVSHAFHTRLLEPVAGRFHAGIEHMRFRPSPVRVAMNHTGAYYPADPASLRDVPALLREQILQPVHFLRSVQKLYDDGVRLFVEVGPGSILSSLVKDILPGGEVSILTSNFKNTDDLLALRRLCAALFAEGVPVKPRAVRLGAEAPGQAPAAPAKEALPQPTPAVKGPGSRVMYSGVAIGLPGSYKETFRDDNFDQVFEGRNFIERLTDEERQALVDLQITKLIKEESGPTFKLLTSLDDVIQLAGKIGRLDLVRDYHIDEKAVQNMSSSIAHGVAAGYEALCDARIPLIREYSRTSTGKLLPQKLALPQEMQDETGVIFANGFPLIDPVIEEVSRHIGYTFGSKTRRELMTFYESLISRVKDDAARKLLTDWYTLYYSRLTDRPGDEEVYRFNHQFMTQISAQANNLLASLLNARGPNFQLNAACSSTSNAITIAEDFIRSGRVKRMIIVGADDPSSRTNFALLGAGFLCTGAATSEADLYRAAIPFDRRRNGMIVGAGAVGLVLEADTEAEKRGVGPICELLGSHSFNTAKHISQIDPDTFARALDSFMHRMEREHGLRREELAERMLYLSHETSTPPRGGCSQTEVEALRRAFGESFRKIIVGNTKGMTGHTMGASLEDAVAARALQDGKCPPVVNHTEPDPMLEGLLLWKGGTHTREFALKMSAGFGAQGHFILLRKVARGDDRITDHARHQAWLRSVTSQEQPVTERRGRVLQVRETQGTVPAARVQEQVTTRPLPAESPRPAGTPPDRRSVAEKVVRIVSQVTGYPPEMLEEEMEFDADLGVDKAKREAISSRLAEERLGGREIIPVTGELTVGQLVSRVASAGAADPGVVPGSQPRADAGATPQTRPGKEALTADVLKVFSEVTKYPVDMLELDLEMEADLGIDTVKQATILSMLGEKYRLERQEGMQLSNYPTIGHIVDLIYEKATPAGAPPVQSPPPAPQPLSPRAEPVPAAGPEQGAAPAPVKEVDEVRQAIIAETLRVFSEVTKYPPDMLDLDMEMEADLGIDTVKQATILSMLGEKYLLERQEGMQLSNYPTIRHIVELIYERGKGVPRASASPAPAEPRSLEDPAPAPAASGAGTSDLSRQAPVLVEEDLGPRQFDLQGKSAWVLGDDLEVVEKIVALLGARNARAERFVFPRRAAGTELAHAIEAFAGDRGADVIVDATHLSFGGALQFGTLERQEAMDLLSLSSDARFRFFKHLSAKKALHPAKVLCLTSLDGAFGLDGAGQGVTDPTYGALIGMYKSLGKEWPGSEVRILDLSPTEVSESFDTCATRIVGELECEGHAIEVAYPHGRRAVVKLDDREPGTGAVVEFTERDTFLVTGGGTGITSRILQSLARQVSAKYVVVDLVPLPENIEALAALDEAGLERVREELKQELGRRHNRVTPALLNREYAAVTKAIEIHRNLAALRRMGRTVVYVPCDVRDHAALAKAVDEARKTLGPITAVVHAAGIDRSHLLDQKSVEEFHEVFTVKAQGACNLMDVTRQDPLRLLVAFSSIAGRFGNAAQLDYASANGFLNTWVRMMKQRHPNLHGVSLAWSGWKDVGIAWRNDLVRQRSAQTGLNLIEVEQGTAAFMQEITHPSADTEVVLHRGLGGFLEEGSATVSLAGSPMLDRITKRDGAIDRAYRVFSVERDAFIDQHRLGKVPIMPAVGYAELAAEYYALQAGRRERFVLRGMRFPAAFKLFREQPRELFVEGKALPDGRSWSIDIKSSFRPAKSEEPQIVLHSAVTVSDEAPDTHDLDPAQWSYSQAEAMSLPAEQSLMLITSEGPEQRIILGPLYNDVMRDAQAKAPVLVYPRGTTYPTYFPREQLTNPGYPLHRMLVNPCLLDSVYQACAAHLLVTRKRIYLPWEIAELGILDVPREEGLYRCHTQIVEESDEVVGFNVVMVDGKNRIRYYARGARFRLINL